MLTLQSETDVVGLGGGLARQPDSDRFRLWEVAGAAHAETYLLAATNLDTGKLSPEELASLLDSTEGLDRFPTEVPINSGPQSHYVGHAALAGLDRWVRGAGPPPEAARLELNETGDGFVLDDNGNARGGVRTPWVDVPTAALSGLGQNGADFAFSSAPPDALTPRCWVSSIPEGATSTSGASMNHSWRPSLAASFWMSTLRRFAGSQQPTTRGGASLQKQRRVAGTRSAYSTVTLLLRVPAAF